MFSRFGNGVGGGPHSHNDGWCGHFFDGFFLLQVADSPLYNRHYRFYLDSWKRKQEKKRRNIKKKKKSLGALCYHWQWTFSFLSSGYTQSSAIVSITAKVINPDLLVSFGTAGGNVAKVKVGGKSLSLSFSPSLPLLFSLFLPLFFSLYLPLTSVFQMRFWQVGAFLWTEEEQAGFPWFFFFTSFENHNWIFFLN